MKAILYSIQRSGGIRIIPAFRLASISHMSPMVHNNKNRIPLNMGVYLNRDAYEYLDGVQRAYCPFGVCIVMHKVPTELTALFSQGATVIHPITRSSLPSLKACLWAISTITAPSTPVMAKYCPSGDQAGGCPCCPLIIQ